MSSTHPVSQQRFAGWWMQIQLKVHLAAVMDGALCYITNNGWVGLFQVFWNNPWILRYFSLQNLVWSRWGISGLPWYQLTRWNDIWRKFLDNWNEAVDFKFPHSLYTNRFSSQAVSLPQGKNLGLFFPSEVLWIHSKVFMGGGARKSERKGKAGIYSTSNSLWWVSY